MPARLPRAGCAGAGAGPDASPLKNPHAEPPRAKQNSCRATLRAERRDRGVCGIWVIQEVVPLCSKDVEQQHLNLIRRAQGLYFTPVDGQDPHAQLAESFHMLAAACLEDAAPARVRVAMGRHLDVPHASAPPLHPLPCPLSPVRCQAGRRRAAAGGRPAGRLSAAPGRGWRGARARLRGKGAAASARAAADRRALSARAIPVAPGDPAVLRCCTRGPCCWRQGGRHSTPCHPCPR